MAEAENSKSVRLCRYCNSVIPKSAKRGPPKQFCGIGCRRPSAKAAKICLACGIEFLGAKNASCCSPKCKGEAIRRKRKESAAVARCPYCGKKFKPHYQNKRGFCSGGCFTRSKMLVADTTAVCLMCGNGFKKPKRGIKVYCSRRCAERACMKRKRQTEKFRERERQYKKYRSIVVGAGDSILPEQIFERDGWVCQLCGKPVDRRLKFPHPMSASLDHITPISKGGEHVRVNVQCSHFSCNSRKNNKLGSQMLLFG